MNHENGSDAGALRELLKLYADYRDPVMGGQIEGVLTLSSQPMRRRMKSPGPIVSAHGIELTVTCDEQAFEGYGLFLFGSVLQKFFGRYVSIDSFTETVIKSNERGEIMRWRDHLPDWGV